jgi:SAM-dependent methyltransferase
LGTELRLSFGNAAEDYERGRPEWPEAIADIGGLPPAAEVLDLGAGTAKLTRVLARRFRRVTAVEPDASMRAVLCQVTDCHLVVEGSAERIPLGDSSVESPFEPLREEHLDHVHVQTRDEAVAQLLSISIFAALPEDDRAALTGELRTSLPDATFRMPMRAEVWWTRLR